jgi:hypothetical protein
MEISLFIIHIGTFKTGSSTIQNFLALNADRLERREVLYPKIGRPRRARVGSRLRKACIRIMRELELDHERAQYLTREQHAECDAAYARDVLRLNERIVGPRLPLPDMRAIDERPFLPALERIPADQRIEISRRLAAALRLDRDARGVRARPPRDRLARLGMSRELRQSLVQTVAVPPG